ncbi:hypothetical protein SEA_OLICIOUS_85 [Streptomyces phage Olicious]|uniref:Uncharacterized protein n=1 Tax=Streptomyces phage Olicious TaxID=2488981 RepID=A0A3G8FPF1_9CAUD|nr:hypothetical protein SEA_OLICIOUS_85 [Streptomyces phage Olicious]
MLNFDETFMSAGDPLVTTKLPGFGAVNRTASTSRVGRKAAKSTPLTKPVRKGLARSAVSVKSIGERTFEVRVKGSLHILGYVRKSNGSGGKAYSYKLIGEKRSHSGFASQKAAVDRMLEKC